MYYRVYFSNLWIYNLFYDLQRNLKKVVSDDSHVTLVVMSIGIGAKYEPGFLNGFGNFKGRAS